MRAAKGCTTFRARRGGICRLRAAGAKGPFSFAKENGPFGTPRERLLIGSLGLERLLRLRNESACAALPRWVLLYDLMCSYHPLPLCQSRSGVAESPSTGTLLNAASASNAAFGTQSAAKQSSLAPHDSKARLQNGYESQGFMAKPCTPHPIAQRMQSFKRPTANVGGRGGLPSSFSGGFKGGILFEKRIPPLPRAPRQVGTPIQRPRRCKTHAPLSGAKKGAFYGTYNESHCQNPL